MKKLKYILVATAMNLTLTACKKDCTDKNALAANPELAAQCQADSGANPSPTPKPSATPAPTPGSTPVSTPTPVPTATPKPSATPVSTPVPSPTPVVVQPSPTPANGGRDLAGIDESVFFQDVAYSMGLKVDSYYPASRELLVQRRPDSTRFPVDHCDPVLAGKDTFADRVSYAVNLKTRMVKAELGYVASNFNLPADVNTYLPNSLISQPLCKVSAQTLNVTFDGKNIPSQAVIDKMNRFNDLHNQYRQEAMAGQASGLVNLNKLWSKFFMCLGYMESLTSADSKESDVVAARYNWRRPAGVNMHDDPYQHDPASVMGLGVFQFAPDVWGDARSCLLEWNKLYPSCQINIKSSWQQMLDVMGSSLQTFNAFCAAGKVTSMFSVQLNSKNSLNTHPSNVGSDGKLKASNDRCVSPFMNVRRSYNHFGPLQNVHGITTDQVLTCTLKP